MAIFTAPRNEEKEGKGSEKRRKKGNGGRKQPWNKFLVTTLAALEKVGVSCQVIVLSVTPPD